MGLSLDAPQADPMADYLLLLDKWNRTYNLTALRTPAAMLAPHVLDSLSVRPHVQGRRVADVASGAGLPGIPLAVTLPETAFTLVDANSKKTRFMRHAVAELGLGNVEVEQARVENYHPPAGYETVVCRAWTSLGDFARRALHLCASGGCLLAMKGRRPDAELAALAGSGLRAEVLALAVPGVRSARHVVRLTRGEAA